MSKKLIVFIILVLGLIYLIVSAPAFSRIIRDGNKTFIVDMYGERWEVTQAMSIGFEPGRFRHGIGRNAFTPLDDTSMSEDPSNARNQRVIGVSGGKAANAYSVARLYRHETANSFLGDTPITAAYWPLVDLAAVYSREIDGRTLTLVPTGWTYDSTFVLYDRETGSLWYPYEKGLMGIQGEYFKRWLPTIASDDTQWKDWMEKHPKSKLMD